MRFADIDGIGGHHSLSCSLRGIIYLKSRLIFILRPQNQINVAMSKDVTMSSLWNLPIYHVSSYVVGDKF